MKVRSRSTSLAAASERSLELDGPLREVRHALQDAKRWLSEPASPPAPVDWVDWDDLMRRHGHRVVVALLARGVPVERAKELAQEAWWRIIQGHRAGRLDHLEVPGVVITQAQYLALDDHRRSEHRYVYDPLHSESGEDASPPDHRHLEQQVAARHQLRRIQAVVSRCHPNAQRVFALLYGGEGRSAADIADELGLSVQRVRQILCELRQKIRRELGTPTTRRGR